ncbi:MAG: hypothetical protein ORN24_06095 [Burkholderiales bacterium]|nr:hypothetical protein [Burkholderiales bacterium]
MKTILFICCCIINYLALAQICQPEAHGNGVVCKTNTQYSNANYNNARTTNESYIHFSIPLKN